MNELTEKKEETSIAIRNAIRKAREAFDNELAEVFDKPIFSLSKLKGRLFQGVTREQTIKQGRKAYKEGKGCFNKPSDDCSYDDPEADAYYRENRRDYLNRNIGARLFLGSSCVAPVFSYYLGYESKYDNTGYLVWTEQRCACANAICRYFDLPELYDIRSTSNYKNTNIWDYGVLSEDLTNPIVTPDVVFQAYKDFPLPYAYKRVMQMKLEKEKTVKKIGTSGKKSRKIEMEDDSIIDMTDYVE